MSGKRVPVLDPEGKFTTVDESEVGQLPDGARVLTKKEIAVRAEQEAYSKLPTGVKVLGGVNTALGVAAGPIGWAAGGTAAPTQSLRGYSQGVNSGLTAGLADAATKKALDTDTARSALGAAGNAAGASPLPENLGQRYAQSVAEGKEASPIAHGLGEAVGLVGGSAAAGAGAAGKLIPTAAITAMGEGAELATQAVGRFAGYTGESALGRAAMSAAELGVRGAAETALYNSANELSRQLMEDPELNADKLYAAGVGGAVWGGLGGVALGGAGSLAKSGLGAAIRSVRGASAKTAEGVAAVGDAAATAVREEARSTAEGLGLNPRTKLGDVVSDLRTVEGQKGMAYDQAWKAVGAGQGLQTTRYAAQAEKYLPNGTRDVGEAIMRHGIIDATGGWFQAAKTGTPAAMLPKLEEQVGIVGKKIGNITDATGARVSGEMVDHVIESVAKRYDTQAGRMHVADQLRQYGLEMKQALGTMDAEGPTAVRIQELLEQRKVLDDIVYQENKTLDPKGRVAALRIVRSGLEDLIMDSMDKASGQVPGALRDDYKALKKDYLALSIAKDAAEDSATRMAKNRTVSMSDYATAAAAAASGHLMAAPVAAVGHKLVRERGNAAAAVAIYNAAHSGQLMSIVDRIDAKLNSAAHGLLASPEKKPLPFSPKESPRVRAGEAMKRIVALQSDPDGTAERLSKNVEGVSATHPDLAQSIVARQVNALSFLASKMPVAGDKDPLDPHPVPRMSDADAATFAKYVDYASQPTLFFDEMARGKVTYEGAETARALMPRAFEELQARMMDAMATHMARGRSIDYQQRLKIGDVLDIPATASQQPGHGSFLQQNVVPLPQTNKPAPAKPQASPAKSQQSALDMLEANGPGRR